MPPKAAPIPQDTMANKLASTPFLGQDVRALLRSEAWNELDSRNAQLVFLDAFARIDCTVPLDSGHLAGVFDLTRDRLRKLLTESKTFPTAPLSTLSYT
jgi:hypothetical protein